MPITLNGTTGITTPSLTSEQGLTSDGISFANNTPANTLVTDTSGNVGIGTSSPATKLDVIGAVRVNEDGAGTKVTQIRSNYAGLGPAIQVTTNDPLLFLTNNTERMRIDSSGNLLVNTTTATNPSLSQGFVTVNATGTKNAMVARLNQSGYTALAVEPIGHNSWYFGYMANSSGGNIGSISCNSTNTAYNTSSDYRLKENIAPMTGALAKVSQLKPCTYTWKIDGSAGQGFIAHELAEVCPDAVVGEKDAVDEEGKPVYQGIDTSFLVATLTAALQELNAKVDALQTELATLKGAS